MRLRRFRAVAPVVVLCALSAGLAHAQQPSVADPVQAEPQQIEASVAPAPMTVLVEEVELMLEMARRQAGTGASLVKRSEDSAEGATGGQGRVIEIEVPPVVNHTPYFRFEDVTDRSVVESSSTATPAQRRSAVEIYRQSLVGDRQRKRSKTK